MKKILPQILKWLVPVFFLALAVFFYTGIHGHSFLGLICIGIAGVITCYYLIAMIKRKYFTAGKILTIAVTTILIFGILAFCGAEVLVLKASLGNPETACEYIVILGAKVNGTQPSISLSDRLQAAEEYLTAHPDTIAILSGGQGANEGISEAKCMYDWLTAAGIDNDRLWLEDKASSTWENLTFSLALIEAKTGNRPEKIGILSSEYHLYRASLFAKDCGVEAVGIPAATSWFSIRVNYFLREAAGVWHYLILGGQYHD